MDRELAFEELRDVLWYLLVCRCARCRAEIDLTEFDRLRERDTYTWSRIAAERASAEGWTVGSGEPSVLCDKCSP